MTRKELMRMMPKNADDIAAAECIIALGHTAIAPVMRDMVKTMRIAKSPVADAFAAYFGRLGQAAVEQIGQGLMKAAVDQKRPRSTIELAVSCPFTARDRHSAYIFPDLCITCFPHIHLPQALMNHLQGDEL